MSINPTRLSGSEVLKQAYGYWSRTLLYQVAMSLLYFSVLFLAFYYGAQRFGVLEQYIQAANKIPQGSQAYMDEMMKIMATENYQKFYWMLLATMVFLYPLNFGLFKIYRKLDLGEKIDFQDLFAGYMGHRFFSYISFYLFWILIYNLLMPTVVLAAAWVMVTLFCGPLLFFMNKRIFEGIPLSAKAFPKFTAPTIICVLVAILVKYIGLFSIFGAIFTFPFWNAVIYTLYQNIFDESIPDA